MQDGWERRHAHLTLDREAVRVLLEPAFPGCVVVEAEPLSGGLANTNYRVMLAGRDEPVVLRLYTRDETACAREAALARLVAGRVPVAEVLYADPAGAVGGQPYAVLRWVEGVKLERLLAEDDVSDMGGMARAVGATLAEIHSFGFPRSGNLGPDLAVTEPLGTPREMTEGHVGELLREPLVRERLGGDLTARVEALLREQASALDTIVEPMTLVQADYKAQNLLLRRDSDSGWRMAAVLDWEFAHAGTPLLDLGILLRYRHTLPPDFTRGVIAGYAEAGGFLPAEWPRLTRLLDLLSLAEFLAWPDANARMVADMRALAERTLEELT